MSATPPRVLVVGAGIAGLALARALVQRGTRPHVVERVDAWEGGGTGLYLPGNAVRALGALGLDAEVSARAFVITEQSFRDHRGRRLFDVAVDRFWTDVGACLGLMRADLHQVLRDGVSGADVRMGTTVQELRGDGPVCATFSDGSTGEYDVVVDAGGIHSNVRRLLFADSAPRYVGQVSWRFVVDGFPDVTAWTVLLGRGSAFLMVPVGGGRLYCYADMSAPGPDDPTGGSRDRLVRLFAGFCEPVPTILGRLDPASPLYFAPIEEVVQQPWVRGAAVLVGDAAHATSPNMAEGAALALEDAVALAEILHSGEPLRHCLAAYEEARRPRAAWVLAQTHRRDRARGLPAPVRSAVLRLAGAAIFRSNYRRLLQQH